MNDRMNYGDLLEKMKANKPRLENQDDLVRDIMQKIEKKGPVLFFPEILYRYLFGWTEIYWIRMSLAAVTIIFVLIFVSQQVFINESINRLENRIIPAKSLVIERSDETRKVKDALEELLPEGLMTEDQENLSGREIRELICAYFEQENMDCPEYYLLRLYKRNINE